MPGLVLLGVDFGGSKIALAVADDTGERLGEAVLPVRPADSAQQSFDRAVARAHQLLADVAPDRRLEAVGACTFGIPRVDRIDLAPNIAGWEQLAFGRRLQLAFPDARVTMATDVKAAAAYEAEYGALVGHDPGLYLNLGTGLAAAIVTHGVVLTGRHGAAGEIGYNLRHVGDGKDDMRLEEVVSGKALAAAGAALPGGVASLLDPETDDPRAARLRSAFLDELGYHLVNLAIAVDPARVVVGGGMVRSWDRLRPALEAALADAVPFPPEIVSAAHPYDAPLCGALVMAASAVASPTDHRPAYTEGAPA
jgi:glucokinase